MDISCRPSRTYKCHSIFWYHSWLVQSNQPCDFTMHAQNVTQAYTSNVSFRLEFRNEPSRHLKPKGSSVMYALSALRAAMQSQWCTVSTASFANTSSAACVGRADSSQCTSSCSSGASLSWSGLPSSAHGHNRSQHWQQNATDMGTDMAKVFHTSFISTSDTWDIQQGCMNPSKPAGRNCRNQLFF